MNNYQVIALSIIGVAIQIFGALRAPRLSIREPEEHPGLLEINTPTGWKAALGDVTNTCGMIIGLIATIVSLYLS